MSNSKVWQGKQPSPQGQKVLDSFDVVPRGDTLGRDQIHTITGIRVNSISGICTTLVRTKWLVKVDYGIWRLPGKDPVEDRDKVVLPGGPRCRSTEENNKTNKKVQSIPILNPNDIADKLDSIRLSLVNYRYDQKLRKIIVQLEDLSEQFRSNKLELRRPAIVMDITQMNITESDSGQR